MKTFQEAFDVCVNHLLTQKVRSRAWVDAYEDYACRYRGDKGLMCGIGPLIADDFYTPSLEGLEASHPLVLASIIDSGWGDLFERGRPSVSENAYLLDCIQNIHDRVEPEEWEEALMKFAIRNQLEWNYVER